MTTELENIDIEELIYWHREYAAILRINHPTLSELENNTVIVLEEYKKLKEFGIKNIEVKK